MEAWTDKSHDVERSGEREVFSFQPGEAAIMQHTELSLASTYTRPRQRRRQIVSHRTIRIQKTRTIMRFIRVLVGKSSHGRRERPGGEPCSIKCGCAAKCDSITVLYSTLF